MFNNKIKVVGLLMAIVVFLTIVYLFRDVWSFSQIKAHASELMLYVEQNRLKGMFIFILVYYALCSIPFPFVSVLTMLSGFLFGIGPALLITSFASALGACTLFVITRYFIDDWVRKNVTPRFETLQLSADSNDFWAAFSIRLVPGMPFFVPSMALALTNLSLIKFYSSTQLGLFVTIFVFVNAGSSLSNINSVSDVFSQELIVAMLLLAILPFTIKALANFIKNRSPQA